MSNFPLANGVARYLQQSSTQAALALTAGRYAIQTAPDTLRPYINNNKSLQLFEWGRGLSAFVRLFGSGADNGTFVARLFLYRYNGAGLAVGGEVDVVPALDITAATLSTAVGLSGSALLTNSERLCDTLTMVTLSGSTTPKGPMDALQTAFGEGTAQLYSPADNTPALIVLPHLGRSHGCLIEFGSLAANATGANALIDFARA